MNDIIKKNGRKDSQAFMDLINLHVQSMYKTAWAYLKNDEDVADVIQETILTCYEKLDTLRQEKYFKTWMTRILINKCNDCLRQSGKIYPMQENMEYPYEEVGFYDCEWKEVISCLDKKYREVIILYYGQAMSVKEISSLLNVNKNTVMTRLARAREQLRKEYRGGGIYER